MKLEHSHFLRILVSFSCSLVFIFGLVFLFTPKRSLATSSVIFSFLPTDEPSLSIEVEPELTPLETYEPESNSPEIISETLIDVSSSAGEFVEDFSESPSEFFQIVDGSVSSITLTAKLRALTADGETIDYEKSETFSLLPGTNDLTFNVSGANGYEGTVSARIERAALEDAEVVVTNISPNYGSLSPAFDPATTDYTLNVENSVETVTLTISYTLNGEEGAWVTTKSNLTPGGENPFTFTFNELSYKVTIRRAAPQTSTYPEVLVNLYPGVGAFNETFSESRTEYSMSVDYETTSLTFFAEIQASDGVSTYLYIGSVSGLGTGTTLINFEITGTSDLSRTVTISVTRAEAASSSDASEDSVLVNGSAATLNSETGVYEYTIPYDTESATIRVTPTDLNASVSPATMVVTPSEGGSVVSTFTITSADGSASKTLRVRVTREYHPLSSDNTIRRLTINGDAVAEEDGVFTYSYTNDSGDANLVISMNDSTATISGGFVQYNNIAEGVTITITLTATAEDGSTRTYIVKITRNAEVVVSTLAYFAPVRTDLSFNEEFDPDRDSYTLNVDYETTAVEILSRLSNGQERTVTLNPIQVGTNPFTVTIDDSTGLHKEIDVTIYRAGPPASTDTSLASISVNGTVLSPNAEGNYSTEIGYYEPSAAVVVTTNDENATVSPAASETLSLARGESMTRTYIVTAEDGETTNTFTLTLSRPAAHFEIDGIDVASAINVTRVSDTEYAATLPSDIETVYYTVRPHYNFQTISVSANNVDIAEGETKTFTIRVTDTNVDDYKDITLNVTRSIHDPSTDASVGTVKINGEEVLPDDDGVYRADFDYETDSAVITVTTNDSAASVSPTTQTLELSEGSTRTTTFTITAEDSSSITYSVEISRGERPADPDPEPEDPEPENPAPETPDVPETPTTPESPVSPAGPRTPETGNVTVRSLFSRETLSPLLVFSGIFSTLFVLKRKLFKLS